jgi:hypothetical protein
MEISDTQQLAIQALISQRVGRDMFDTYFAGMDVQISEQFVIVNVLDEYCARFIRMNTIFKEDITDAVTKVTGAKIVGMLVRGDAVQARIRRT